MEMESNPLGKRYLYRSAEQYGTLLLTIYHLKECAYDLFVLEYYQNIACGKARLLTNTLFLQMFVCMKYPWFIRTMLLLKHCVWKK